MGIWHTKLGEQADEGRAERIILKKRRKQDPGAKGLSAIAISRPGSRAQDDRGILRDKSAEAIHQGQRFDVTLLDLSSNGIMIAGDIPVTRGDELSLAIEGSPPIVARVSWLRDGRLGLEFSAHTEIFAEPETRKALLDAVWPTKEAGAEIQAMAIPGPAAIPELVWTAKLACEGRKTAARLRTLAEVGAILSVAEPIGLTEGAKATLEFTTIGRSASEVIWCANQQIYVRFDKPFDLSALRSEPCAEIVAKAASALGAFRGHEGHVDMDLIRIAALRKGEWREVTEQAYRSVSLNELHALLAAPESPAITES